MSFLDDLQAEVRRHGIRAVARSGGLPRSTVQRFLRDPTSIRISTFSRLCRAVHMPHGEFHLVDDSTGVCVTCKLPRDQHYPLFPDV